MNADQRRELLHLDITTREGHWSHRTPRAIPASLVKLGYAEADPKRADFYRITPAGIAAIHGAAPARILAWCDRCGAMCDHYNRYDHVTGERWECAGCVEKEGVN